MTYQRPVLSWPGNKFEYLSEIISRFPKEFNDYFEPCIGSASVFLNADLSNKNIYLSDVNPRLINLYHVIKTKPNELIMVLNNLFSKEDTENNYYKTRNEFNNINNNNSILDPVYEAACLIYLNKTGFNGLYRENKSGAYNVPWGKKKKIKNSYSKEIYRLSDKLNNTKSNLICNDFEYILLNAKFGDFVYWDTPFYGTFGNYAKTSFKHADHERVLNCFLTLNERGVKQLMSNSSTDFIVDNYYDFNIEYYSVRYRISGGEWEERVELAIRNYDE